MKSFFEQMINKLFKNNLVSASKPFMREPLQRSARFKTAYAQWQDNGQAQEIVAKIAESYFYHKGGVQASDLLSIFNSQGANGIAIHPPKSWKLQQCQFIVDYFCHTILQKDYHKQVAELQVFDLGQHVKTVEKYYLKPSILGQAQAAGKLNQQFGNITLELVSLNDQPALIKVLVTYYADHLFTQVLDFEDFLRYLWQIN